MARGGMLVVAVAVGAMLSAGNVAVAASPDLLPAPGATLKALTQAVGGRGATAAPARYAYLRKLAGPLQGVALDHLATGSGGSSVSVDVYVDGNVGKAAEALRALGMRVTATSDRAPMRGRSKGSLPPERSAQAAALPTTHAIVSTFARAQHRDVALRGRCGHQRARRRARSARHGAGVPVGIISDSINQVTAGGRRARRRRAICRPTCVSYRSTNGGTDEGRAMAEIVYDEAPGISGIAFASGTLGGAVEKAAAIDALVATA